jgi:hypothetical protein
MLTDTGPGSAAFAGIDRTGVDPNDFTNLGEAVFDPLFDITSEEVQAHILATCESVQAQAERLELTPDAGSQDCVMQQFARSRQRVGLPFPVASANFTVRLPISSGSPRVID